MLTRIRKVIASADQGASAVEYGLLVAGIAALIVAIVFLFGGFIGDIFSDTCATINANGTNTQGTAASCGANNV